MNEKKQKELLELKMWGDTILVFFLESSELSRDSVREISDILNKCFENGRLSQLKMVIGDINEMATGMIPKHVKELNRILQQKFGNDLCSIDKMMARRMDGVLKQGKIRNDDEYVRVSEWIDHLLWNSGKSERQQEIEIFEKLMGEYEIKVENRRKS